MMAACGKCRHYRDLAGKCALPPKFFHVCRARSRKVFDVVAGRLIDQVIGRNCKEVNVGGRCREFVAKSWWRR